MTNELRALVEASCKRARRVAIILFGVGVLFLILPISTAVAAFDDPPKYRCTPRTPGYAKCVDSWQSERLTSSALLAILPGAFAALALLIYSKNRSADTCAVGRALNSQRQDIGWIYPKQTTIKRYGATVGKRHAVVIVLRGNKRLELNLLENEIPLAMRLVSAEAPQALVGYTDANRAAFAQGGLRPLPPTERG